MRRHIQRAHGHLHLMHVGKHLDAMAAEDALAKLLADEFSKAKGDMHAVAEAVWHDMKSHQKVPLLKLPERVIVDGLEKLIERHANANAGGTGGVDWKKTAADILAEMGSY